MPTDDVTLQSLGDSAIRMQFGTAISPETNARIRRFCRVLERDPIRGVVEWVPGYTTLAVYYQPWVAQFGEICARLGEHLSRSDGEPLLPARTVDISVWYGGPDGPDLEDVAALHGLTPADVIALHTGPTYLVYMLGFMPGFAYLGGLTERLATPRLVTPRIVVPAGSVGIGGAQTGVYPLATPGGWRIIGRTPLRLFDLERDPPALLQAGDLVRFVAEETDAAN